MEEIVIKGDCIVLQDVSEIKRIPTDEFYMGLMKLQNISTPVFPLGVVHYSSKDNKRIYVTLQKPCERTINIREHEEDRQYSVKVPYIYFIHEYINNAFENLYVFCSNSEIDSDSDMLCKIPLKNIYQDGRVCLGNSLKFDLTGKLKQKLNHTEMYFWDSHFNSDLDSYYLDAAPEILEGEPIENWSELSDDNDFNPCDIEWLKYKSLSQILNAILGGAV